MMALANLVNDAGAADRQADAVVDLQSLLFGRKNEYILAKISKISNYIFMAKNSNVKIMLPQAVERNLQQMGQHIHIARKRRRESQPAPEQRFYATNLA